MLTDSGILYMKLGQTQFAFERLSSALALEPTHYKALLGVGCITQVGKFKLVRPAYNDLLNFNVF